LRAIVYDGPLADLIKLVVTGSSRVVQIREEGSPLLNAVNLYYLGTVPDEAIEAIASRAGAMAQDIRQAVVRESGGHPFLATYILSHLWQTGLETATTDQIDTACRECRQSRQQDFAGWWQAVGDSGRLAYALMAGDRRWFKEAEFLDMTARCRQPLNTGLSALAYHGLVNVSQDRSQWQVAGNLFRDWYLTSGARTTAETNAMGDGPDGDVLAQYSRLKDRLDERDLILLSEAVGIRLVDLKPGGLSDRLLELMLLTRSRGRLPVFMNTLGRIRPDLEL
jgi:hypothetical protein